MSLFKRDLGSNSAVRPIAVSEPRKVSWKVASPRRAQLPEEWLELAYAVETLRVRNRTVAVQFIGATDGVGTTTVACGFARAAGQASEESKAADGKRGTRSVLYVDCKPSDGSRKRDRDLTDRPNSLVETFMQDLPILSAVVPASDADGVCWAWLGQPGDAGPASCSPADLGNLLDALRDRFSLIVLDCPPVHRGVIALSLTRHCDGVLLVLRAKRTTVRAVQETRDIIERLGGQVVGTVFNRAKRRSGWRARHRA